MIHEIRFVGKGSTYDKTLAKMQCPGSWADALRFAADCLDKTSTDDLAQITGIRLRVVNPAEVPA